LILSGVIIAADMLVVVVVVIVVVVVVENRVRRGWAKTKEDTEQMEDLLLSLER
jgi:hypothetical protein